MKIEKRSFGGEVRMKGDEGRTIVGYGAVFNKRSSDLGGFVEVIDPDAFKNVMDNDVRALIDHKSDKIIGRTKSNTLRIEVDGTGLRYEVDVANTTAGNDLLESVKRGDIDASSFGFRVAPGGQQWTEGEDGQMVRTITAFSSLADVSAVTYPAYPDTTVAKRSLEEFRSAQEAEKEKHKDHPDLDAIKIQEESRERTLLLHQMQN